VLTSCTATRINGNTLSSLNSPIIFTGLTNGISYSFYVTCTNAGGLTSAQSTPTVSATPSTLVQLTVPGPPINIAATGADKTITVTFSPPANTGGSPITSYTLSVLNGNSVTGTGSPITISGLTNGILYTVYVVANNAQGSGSISSTATATPLASDTFPTYLDGTVIFGKLIETLKVNGGIGQFDSICTAAVPNSVAMICDPTTKRNFTRVFRYGYDSKPVYTYNARSPAGAAYTILASTPKKLITTGIDGATTASNFQYFYDETGVVGAFSPVAGSVRNFVWTGKQH
jgi:hypothetical protein